MDTDVADCRHCGEPIHAEPLGRFEQLWRHADGDIWCAGEPTTADPKPKEQ
jgi:hypothetical protein